MKWFKRIVIGLLVLLFLLSVGIYLYMRSTAPKYKGEKVLKGLHEEVEVKYDSYGIPHIYAKSEKDAYYALGWTMAQDRLFQIEMMRRLTYGRLSEILGEDLLDVDKAMLSLGIAERAASSYQKYFKTKDQKYQKSALAFADGINAFIEEGHLPIEFKMIGFEPEEFTAKDIYAIVGYMSYSFAGGLKEDPFIGEIAAKLGEDYLIDFNLDAKANANLYQKDSNLTDFYHEIWMTKNQVDEKMPVSQWYGSNSWVLSGAKTKSGKPILANDTHIKYAQPAIWYEAYIEYPDYQFYGYYLAGVPFPIEGHNSNYGWGLTIFPIDNMDLYAETLNPENKNQYRYGDQWLDFTSKNYEIKVKDSHNISFELKSSIHGPIINDAYAKVKSRYPDNPIAMWWVGNRIENQTIEATYLMSHAKNIEQFEAALPLIDIVGLNVMYADNSGNIAWWATGKIPKRDSSFQSKRVLDGSDTSLTFDVYYSFDKNPKQVNPECGYVITANNPPQRVNGVLYPGYYSPGYRAKRIEDLLSNQEKWNIQDLQKVQLDVLSERDAKLLSFVHRQLKDIDSLAGKHLLEQFISWDGNYALQSKAATFYTHLLYHILHEAFVDEIGEESFNQIINAYFFRSSIDHLIQNESSIWWDNISTEVPESRKDIFAKALQLTHADFNTTDTSAIPAWGAVHQLIHMHPIGRKKPFDKLFNIGPFPMRGSREVVDKEEFAHTNSGIYAVLSGPALRTLVDFAEPDSALGILPTGQSGNVFSPYYSDQASMFAQGKYRRQILNFKDNDIFKSLLLKPEK